MIYLKILLSQNYSKRREYSLTHFFFGLFFNFVMAILCVNLVESQGGQIDFCLNIISVCVCEDVSG